MSCSTQTCWYYSNGFNCKHQSNCIYSHDYNKCLATISSKNFEICPYGINCKQKCNKIHNLEIFKYITQDLANYIELSTNCQDYIDTLEINNNSQSYQNEKIKSSNETLYILNNYNALKQKVEYLNSIKSTLEEQLGSLIQQNKNLQTTIDTLQLLNSCKTN